MQSSCLRLMGKKMLVSLAMEGKFCREGLQTLEEDEDILTAMARELVTETGIGESAAAVWRQIQREHAKIVPVAIVGPEPLPAIEEPSPTASPVAPAPIIPAFASDLKFGSRPPSVRPVRRELLPAHVQLPLF
jgi:hypothetical protein